MEYINGKDLYQMFNYGSYNILKERQYLNEINVFPVPDSDTGNNLASTMQAIKQNSKPNESFHYALDSISESALYGARGNSGVIFAQFCNGLRFASKGKAKVTILEFANMVNESVDFVYQSITNPVEGTMLTVISDWANSLKNIVKIEIGNIKYAFEQAFLIARKSLELTKEKLHILKKHDVVDSGALGFVLFLDGINRYYNEEELDIEEIEQIEVEHIDEHDVDVKFRYCTEGLVMANKSIDQSNLRADLQSLGDSLIIAKGLNIFRVHIHTDNPEIVYERLEKYGKIISQKVDNMKLDISLKQNDKKTVIVTDSIGDLPIEYINNNNIVVIPINVQIEDVDYFDKLSINNRILFDKIAKYKEYPTTATPSIKHIEDVFLKLMEDYDELLVISVASKLSATYNLFSEAAKKLSNDNKKITVIDTLTNSITEGLLVHKASELLKSGKTVDEIVKAIDEAKQKTKILVCLKTVKYATKSGRLPKVIGAIGNFIGMRPIMSLDKEGNGEAFSIAFSKKGITKKIIKLVKKEMEEHGIERYGLVHCLNPKLLEEYTTIFTNLIGKEPKYITEVSNATAIHSGIGTVAIGYIRE